MYEYTRENGWREIDDFLDAKNEDFEKSLIECGYQAGPQISVGKTDIYRLDIHTESYNSPVEKYKFIAVLDVSDMGYTIALPDLPDFVAFMSEVAPGINSLAQLTTYEWDEK